MTDVLADAAVRTPTWRSHAGIPVRNLWILLAYAADLARFRDRVLGSIDDAAELPDVLARLLATVVERRLRRNPSRGYVAREQVLGRVRGRIDHLETFAKRHSELGRVACRFEELAFDTPRNRLVRAALLTTGARTPDVATAVVCRGLARDMGALGIGAERPSKTALAGDPVAGHWSDDRLMVSVALAVLDLVLPSEEVGTTSTTRLERDEALLRRIFEKAVAGFYRHELHGSDGWWLSSQSPIGWLATEASAEMADHLPRMVPDLALERRAHGRRVVLDTKFTGALAVGRFGNERFKSGHLYQLYAYLRSQAGRGDALADRAEGILVYPTLDREVDEHALIQGHRVRFATVDLSAPSQTLLDRLRSIVVDEVIPPPETC